MPAPASAYNRLINRPGWLGLRHIVWFNWHFYVLVLLLMVMLVFAYRYTSGIVSLLLLLILLGAALTLIVSLLVSWYVYDLSGLYSLGWLKRILPQANTIINIHAGFDETSPLLQLHYPRSRLIVYDFYDPQQHTEVSIARARKAYPPYPGTRPISTRAAALPVAGADVILLILAAHEIRNDAERAAFLRMLAASLIPQGTIVVAEHLRDLPNFLAYTVGAFHFLPWSTWQKTFDTAGLHIRTRQKINPFIHLIVLTHADHTS